MNPEQKLPQEVQFNPDGPVVSAAEHTARLDAVAALTDAAEAALNSTPMLQAQRAEDGSLIRSTAAPFEDGITEITSPSGDRYISVTETVDSDNGPMKQTSLWYPGQTVVHKWETPAEGEPTRTLIVDASQIAQVQVESPEIARRAQAEAEQDTQSDVEAAESAPRSKRLARRLGKLTTRR